MFRQTLVKICIIVLFANLIKADFVKNPLSDGSLTESKYFKMIDFSSGLDNHESSEKDQIHEDKEKESSTQINETNAKIFALM